MKAVTNRYENFLGGRMVRTYSFHKEKKIGILPLSYGKLKFIGKTSSINYFFQDTKKIFHFNRHFMFMQLHCP